MNDYNTNEKSLIQVNENSIFYKIKRFLKNLFHKKEITVSNELIKEKVEIEDKKTTFIESLKNIENEETLILKLQKQYDNGEIKEEDLTEEQFDSLYDLYEKQIAQLRKNNEIRKQRILEHRRKLQTNS